MLMTKAKLYPFINRFTGAVEIRTKKHGKELNEDWARAKVVKNQEGEVSLDLKGRKPGRGAYVCHDLACLTKARKAKRFERVLECQIPEEVYEAMEKELLDDA